jgi:hypothetical protein
MPSASSFFAEISRALKPGGSILFAEPAGHMKAPLWDAELEAAAIEAGFILADRARILRSHAVLLKRAVAQFSYRERCLRAHRQARFVAGISCTDALSLMAHQRSAPQEADAIGPLPFCSFTEEVAQGLDQSAQKRVR